MKRLVVFLTSIILSQTVLAEVFKVHCRERAPQMMVKGKNCEGPVPELVETALERMGHTVSWQVAPWVRSIKEAEIGEVDLLVRHSMNTEREAFLLAVPYGYEIRKLYYVISPSSDAKISEFSDLKGYRVGALRGSFYSSEFAGASNLNKKTFVSHEKVIKMLEAGRIDVAPTSPSHNEKAYLAIEGVKKSTYSEEILNPRHLSIPKASSKSVYFDDLKRVIEEMISSNEIDAIYKKHGVEPPKQKD